MNVRSYVALRRHFVRAGLCLTVLLATITTSKADEYQTTCNYDGEYCGWVDLWEDTQVAAEPTEPLAKRLDQDKPDQTVSGSSINTVVATLAATTGVKLHQIVEPFAMVGPAMEPSLSMVRDLNDFWAAMTQTANHPNFTNVDVAISEIAEMEPIDVNEFGPSVLMPEWLRDYADNDAEVGIQVTPIDNLVGSAAMIATIEMPYLPYDLSANDLQLRSVFSVANRGLCVRSRAANWNSLPVAAVPMYREIAEVRLKTVPPEPAVGPVDCWMDEVIATIDATLDRESPIWNYARADYVGQQIAALSSSGSDLIWIATTRIASHWPEPIAKPSPAGIALLDRAGIDSEATKTADAQPKAQIAEVEVQSINR